MSGEATSNRLVDLNPSWKMTTDGDVYGIEYDCPCRCAVFDPDKALAYAKSCKVGGRQIVPTKTNFHPSGAPSCLRSRTVGWDLTAGTSFETITIRPSIHQVGHWHGELVNGLLYGTLEG